MNTCLEQAVDNIKNSPLNINKHSTNTLDKFKGLPWRSRFQQIVHNWKTRQTLSTLNVSQLKDIGLTSDDIENEISKAWWK